MKRIICAILAAVLLFSICDRGDKVTDVDSAMSELMHNDENDKPAVGSFNTMFSKAAASTHP